VSGTAVVTDSAGDLDATVAETAGVTVVPLDVRLGPLGPAETAQLSPAEFWQRCTTGTDMPETSAPSPGSFQSAFLEAKDHGYTCVVCVTISSKLSATYQAACAGAAAVKGLIPVAVVDSRTATMGQGMAVLEAARAARAGSGLEEVCEVARDQLSRTSVLGTLDTLDYLRRGGRIGAAQAVFGSLLSIKPVIEVRDGVVEAESRQRTRARSLSYLAEKAAAMSPLVRVAVVHAAASQADLDLLTHRLEGLDLDEAVSVGYIGPVIGAHTGPGTVGLCLVRRRAGS